MYVHTKSFNLLVLVYKRVVVKWCVFNIKIKCMYYRYIQLEVHVHVFTYLVLPG